MRIRVFNRWWVLAALATLALFSGGCSKPPRLQSLAPDATVLAFGDSLTYGTGANENESYPAQLSALIARPVVRAGVPGEVTADGLARLPEMLDEHRPRLVVLLHGGNDLLRRLPKPQAADNVRAMIRLAKGRGAEVVLIGTPEPGLTVTPPEFYGEIAKEFGIPYDDAVIGRILRTPAHKSDPIHPNALGYRVLAERVAELLRKSGAL
jgi:lysophospholipase L1-like esterase